MNVILFVSVVPNYLFIPVRLAAKLFVIRCKY